MVETTQISRVTLGIAALLNIFAGKYISDVLASHGPEDTIYYLDLDPSLNKRLDDMLVDILGDSEAVDRVYNGVKYDR